MCWKFQILIYLCISFSQVANSQIDFDFIEGNSAERLKSEKTSYLRVAEELQARPACQSFLDYVQEDMRTLGLLVIQNGQSKIELYGTYADKNTVTRVWSVSKLFSGMMLGSQVQKHGMSLMDRSLLSFGIERQPNPGDAYSNWESVKLRNVWNMSSGIDWCEYTSCQGMDAASMTYGAGRNHALQYVLNLPISHEPGTYYRYSAGNYVLLQAALRSMYDSLEEYLNSPYQSIFGPLGVQKNEYVFETDSTGLYIGGSGLSITARVFAKLGQLILNRGKWGDTQIFPEEFYEEMSKNSEAIKNSPIEIQNWEGPAGGSIWLNDDSSLGNGMDRDGIPSFFPKSPWDMLYGGGYLGQYLLIYPSSNLVVARLGADKEFYQLAPKFSELALSCFDPSQIRDDYTNDIPRIVPDTGKKMSNIRSHKEGILPAVRAKELCSCLFVGGFKSVRECDAWVPVSLNIFLGLDTNDLTGRVRVDYENETVTVRKLLSQEVFIASKNRLRPELGCSLTKIKP